MKQFVIAILLCVWCVGLLKAQDYKTLKSQVAELEKSGRYRDAEPLAHQALTQVEKEYGKENYRYAAALSKLGEIYQANEKYELAEKIFTDLVAIDKAKYGEGELVYAESISKLGLALYLQGKYDVSLPLFIKASEIKKSKLGEGTSYANALNNIASLQFQLGNYPDAENNFSKALSLFERDEPASAQLANVYNGLGVLYDMIGRYEEAEALLIKAVNLRKQLLGANHPDYAESLRNLAGLYKNMGRYNASELAHQESIQIIKALGEETKNYANSLYNFALLYHATGNLSVAEAMLKQAYTIEKKLLGDQSVFVATTLNGLANLYADVGRFTDAEALYRKQIEINQKLLGEKHPHYATAMANLAALYYQMGRYEQAEKIYLQVVELDKQNFGGMNSSSATVLYYIGVLYRDMNRLPQSEEYFKKALDIQNKTIGSRHPDYIRSMIGLGDTYIRAGKFKEGIELYNQSMSYFETTDGRNSINYVTFINNLGALYKATGNFTAAERWYNESLQQQRELWGDRSSGYMRTLANLGELYYSQRNYKKASPVLKQVIDYYLQEIKTSFPTMSEREKSQFYKTISYNFDMYDSYAVNAGTSDGGLYGNMYNNQLATKGMLIQSSIRMKNQIMRSKDVQLIALYKNWIEKKEQIARANKLSKQERVKRNINLELLENESNELERNLSARTGIKQDNQSYTWQDVKSKLKPGEAAAEIIRFRKYNPRNTVFTDTIYYAVLIVTASTSGNPEMVLLTNGNELETKYLKFYRNVIQQQKNRIELDDPNSYLQFWKRIGDKLPGIKKVYLSVDGFYNQVNLNTLVNPETGKYLMNEIEISIVTNTSDLINLRKTKTVTKKNPNAALIGFPNYYLSETDRNVELIKHGITAQQPEEGRAVSIRELQSLSNIKELPGTKIEVETIGSLLNKNKWIVKTFLNNAALEENIKRVEAPTLYHIATHGFFEADRDDAHQDNLKYENALFRSGLLLAGSAESLFRKSNALEEGSGYLEDGILTAYEAMNLDLSNTELVVLSACETGLGEIANGEGVYGLQRAFRIAGAEALIFSLWKVDDAATQQLMTSFYKNWIAMGNKKEAFVKAQAEIYEQYKLPYFWGAFVLIGAD